MNAEDQQRFDAIRHRLALVTPGPHTVESETLVVAMPGTPEEVVIADTDMCSRSHDQDKANAAFFAHAWADIVYLTERVRDLERQAKGQAHEGA